MNTTLIGKKFNLSTLIMLIFTLQSKTEDRIKKWQDCIKKI